MAAAVPFGIKASRNFLKTSMAEEMLGGQGIMDMTLKTKLGWLSALLVTLAVTTVSQYAVTQDQDQQDDPPSRVARLGYIEGSVSFQPAGESDWVQAVPNRPMTTGDKLWADADSRAEVELGSAVIRLAPNTGFSFLNLDDRTVQIQLSSGSLNLRVRRLDRDNIFEIDTPNQAFTIDQPGAYRLDSSEDGTYTVVSTRDGQGESTGNGQTYTVHGGQRATFSGTDSLSADVVNIGGPDPFDTWANGRDHRYDDSRSAQYLSRDIVGYEDLDENGDWRDDSNYGHVWYPNRVAAGWAPYHDGHWDWIAPWGWTWVDDSSWGYAPFHYGRWVSVGGRWGWIAGRVAVSPVYAPALVVFIGGGGVGFGGNVGWFPLGPREVYVPSYNVSRAYVNRVNISNTTVNTTTITNVYNATIINKTTNITNVTYVNRNVQGAVTAVPQRAFVSAQPVGRAAVTINARDIASAPMSARMSVAPTQASVLGARANTAGRVAAPPAAVANRQVIAKATPPPPPVSFARQQQALAANPGRPIPKRELQTLRPAPTAQARPMVKVAPPGKPATPTMGHPATQPNQPGNQPSAARPGQPASPPAANQPGAPRPGQPANTPPANQPASRPGNQPAPNDRPAPTPQPSHPATPSSPATPNQPNNRPDRPPTAQPNPAAPVQPGNRPEVNRPTQPTPAQPGNRPDANRPAPQPNQPAPARPTPTQPNDRPQPNRPSEPPTQNSRPQPAQPAPARPENRPTPTPPADRAQPSRPVEPPAQSRPAPAQPTPARPDRPPSAQPNNRPEPSRTPPPAEAKPAPRGEKPQTPEEKKREQEQQKNPGA
jgi:hypothetical protein